MYIQKQQSGFFAWREKKTGDWVLLLSVCTCNTCEWCVTCDCAAVAGSVTAGFAVTANTACFVLVSVSLVADSDVRTLASGPTTNSRPTVLAW